MRTNVCGVILRPMSHARKKYLFKGVSFLCNQCATETCVTYR